MRRKYERNYKDFKNKMPQILIFAVFLTGIIIGSLFCNSLNSSADSGAAEVSKLVDDFITNINLNGLPDSYLVGRSFLTYGKQVIFIWLFGLFAFTIPFIGLIVGIQGFSYGFTTSLFVVKYNLKGLLLCLGAYGVQGALFVYMIYILSSEAISFIRKEARVSSKRYFMNLLIAMAGVGLIALYETYIMPVVVKFIIETVF